MIDLDEFFGDNPPVVYDMEFGTDYSENFLVLRFGEDRLSDLGVLCRFYDFYVENNDSKTDDPELIALTGSNLVKSGIFAGNVVGSIHKGSMKVDRYADYSIMKAPFEHILDAISANTDDAQELGFLVSTEDFLIGFSTSWVVFYSPDKRWVDTLNTLATTYYGFYYDQYNNHGHLTIARDPDDLPTSFLAKAPIGTIRYLPTPQKPKGWEIFARDNVDLLNYNIHDMANSIRFHVDIDDAPTELSKLFTETGFSTNMKLVYHGVTAQRLSINRLLVESVYRETEREGMTLQSFVMDVGDGISYLENNKNEVVEDSSIFFGDGFAMGVYASGVDFVFLKGHSAKNEEVCDALEILGYERANWWWEKPESV